MAFSKIAFWKPNLWLFTAPFLQDVIEESYALDGFGLHTILDTYHDLSLNANEIDRLESMIRYRFPS